MTTRRRRQPRKTTAKSAKSTTASSSRHRRSRRGGNGLGSPLIAEKAADKLKRHRVGQNLYDLLGGRDGVLSLLPPDPKDSKASALRDALNTADSFEHDGTTLKRKFDTLYLSAGYTARDLFELFDSRQHATALVVASEAKPRLVGELIDAASQRIVPCSACGGTMQIARVDPDGEFVEWVRCHADHCDDRGNVVVDGNKAARELYFDQFGFKAPAGPLVNVDNRRVEFHVGQPGTAPSPLALIRALELVPDIGAPSQAKMLSEPSTVEQRRVMGDIVEGEVVER